MLYSCSRCHVHVDNHTGSIDSGILAVFKPSFKREKKLGVSSCTVLGSCVARDSQTYSLFVECACNLNLIKELATKAGIHSRTGESNIRLFGE